MKTIPSETVNGGRTIILDHLNEGIERGRQYIDRQVESLGSRKADEQITVGYINRNCRCSQCKQPRADHVAVKSSGETLYYCKDDQGGRTRKQFKEEDAGKTTISYGSLHREYAQMQTEFGKCVEDISKGNPELKEKISELTDDLRDLVLDIAPSLSASYAGFQRSDDGFSVNPDLLAAGEELCCIQRKKGGDSVKQGAGEGAYRIVITTDVEWCGRPDDNAAMIGALVVLLQQFKPVEVWIQQGWLGEHWGDGVTLFKLDFTGAFDVTQLAFWLGNPNKDRVFSYLINKGLGRSTVHSATTSEIPCDLWLRGDWLKENGIDEWEFARMLHTDKVDLMAKWIANTAVRVVFNGEIA